jgi:hypothetical protein
VSRDGWLYCTATKGQVPNTGPYRLRSAHVVRRELARRFAIVEEFGLAIRDPQARRQHGWRRRFAPLYVARVVRQQ